MLDGNKFWTSSEISESLSPQIFDFELLTTYKMNKLNQEVTLFLIELNHPFIEEIPVGTTHALLLREGAVVAQGEVASVITDQNLRH